jgi:hypothetical protein
VEHPFAGSPRRPAAAVRAASLVERLRRALQSSRGPRPPCIDPGAVITLRLARRADAGALEQLAQLASTAAPRGAALLAEVDGQLWAALPLSGGDALRDPFRPTAELCALLGMRASQLDGGDPPLHDEPGAAAAATRARSSAAAAAPARPREAA